MIKSVATWSLAGARQHFAQRLDSACDVGDELHAWVGFETGSEEDRSPAGCSAGGPSLIVRMADIDLASSWRGHLQRYGPDHPLAPTLGKARPIVDFLAAIHAEQEDYALSVHCHAGLWRSGAVAEWVRVDLGVKELETSVRLVDVISGEPWGGERLFNAALLNLLRAAHRENEG